MDDDFKRLEERVNKLRGIFEGVYDKFSEIGEEIDSSYSDLQEDLWKDGKKLSAKERKKLALKLLKEKYPGIVKEFEEIDLIIDGIDMLVEGKMDNLQEILDKLEEIGEMQEEIEQKKAELD